MKSLRILAVLVASGLLFGSAGVAQAYEGCGCNGGGLLNWNAYGASGSVYGLGIVSAPPYFALHPPVYYSDITPRTYGQSPYAHRSARAGLAAPQPRAQVMVNPHMPSNKQPTPVPSQEKNNASERTAAARVIDNPFFNADQRQTPRLVDLR